MNCPNCSTPMQLGRDRLVFMCEYYASVVLPQESNNGIRVLGDLDELKQGIDCPRVASRWTLTPTASGPGNVVVDNCPCCDLLWLDYGELTRIIRAREPKDSW